ncbi:MAG: DUF1054 family protein [Nitrospinae bacterium]|nr:DUF1054 family protein [Nitrospinota bacterium]
MATIGFARDDFEVFGIPTFAERMQALKDHIRPKLIALGAQLQPALNKLAKSEVFPHVAKHARRTVNPPPETWVAFGPSARGYKKCGYLGLVISRGGLHTRIVVKDEADDRPQMANTLLARSNALTKVLGKLELARYDRWDFAGLPDLVKPSADFWQGVAEALTKKTGGLDVGFGWSVDRAVQLTEKHLLAAFEALLPLYEVTRA